MRSSRPNPDLEIVIAREPLPAGRQGSNLAFFNEIAAHLAGARNDRMELAFRFLDRNSGPVFSNPAMPLVAIIEPKDYSKHWLIISND